MNKLARASFWYMIIGLLSGIYYRELTRILNFTGDTMLSVVHTHTLVLGMFFLLIVLLLEKNFNLSSHKNYKKFYITYNSGLGITLLILLIHGTLTVLGHNSSAAVSGIAGVGHIIMTIGLLYFFQVLKQSINK